MLSGIYHLFRRPKRLVENDILMSSVYRRIIVVVSAMAVMHIGIGCYSRQLVYIRFPVSFFQCIRIYGVQFKRFSFESIGKHDQSSGNGRLISAMMNYLNIRFEVEKVGILIKNHDKV